MVVLPSPVTVRPRAEAAETVAEEIVSALEVPALMTGLKPVRTSPEEMLTLTAMVVTESVLSEPLSNTLEPRPSKSAKVMPAKE